MRMFLLVVTSSLLSLTLAIGCAADGDSAPPGTDGVGGNDGAASTPATGGDGGTSASEPGTPPPAPPSPSDPGEPAPDGSVPPLVGKGFTMTVGGYTYSDPDARARRSKLVSGPGAGTFSGLTYVPTSFVLLEQIYQLSFDVKGGGNGYLAVGSYTCSSSKGSQTPFGRSSVGIVVPGPPEAYVSKDGLCLVKVTSAGPSAGTPWRITGTIEGKLVQGLDKVTEATVTGAFDLVYEN